MTEQYADTSFDASNNKPLSNLQSKGRSAQKNQQEQQDPENQNIGKLPWSRPKGSANPKRDLYSDKSVLSHVHLHQHNVCSNRVDERCMEQGIVYNRWVPNPELDAIFLFGLSWILLWFLMNKKCQGIVCCVPK